MKKCNDCGRVVYDEDEETCQCGGENTVNVNVENTSERVSDERQNTSADHYG